MRNEAPIGEDTVLRRSSEPVAVEVDRKVVMMSVDQGMYFGLEGTAPRIWGLLERPRSLRELCEALEQEFDVDPLRCRQEVGAFVQELRQARLISIDDAPRHPPRPAAGA